MKVLISKIKPNPKQPRTVFNPISLQELANSIREHGQEQAISVEDNLDGTYTLSDGERRLRAMQLNGETEIEVFIKPPMHNDLERLIAATAANVARDGLNPVDEGNAYKGMKSSGMKIKHIALQCGTTTTNVNTKLKITKFTEEEQEIMKAGGIPLVLASLDALLMIEDVEDRASLMQVLSRQGATTKIVERTVKRYLKINIGKKVQRPKQEKKKKAETPALDLITDKPEGWDALYQVNRVPPWPIYTEAIMHTCDYCALRPMASPDTCGNCPLVISIQKVFEKVDQK